MKTASENLLGVIKGKSILFLENQADLSIDLEHIETFLKLNQLEYKALNDLPKLDFEVITEAIRASEVIIFQTTWTKEIVSRLHKFLLELKEPKHIIEVYIDKPHWFYKPDAVHEVYIMRTNSQEFMSMYENDPTPNWQFFKLHSTIPIWKFKNKFDK